MITAGAAEFSRYQLYRRHRINAGEVTCVNSVKTLSATSDYVDAENRGDRDQRELRHLVALCQDFRKDAPPTGAHVTTLVGPGTVVGHNVRPTRWWSSCCPITAMRSAAHHLARVTCESSARSRNTKPPPRLRDCRGFLLWMRICHHRGGGDDTAVRDLSG
jgi:hypothetical protein